jgi:hypothetical protein
MRVTSGKVVSGQIVVEGQPLPDGSVVTILARDVDENFELDSTAEAELLLSLAEADRGDLIPAEVVLQTFRERASRRKFEAVLAKIPDVAPDEADRIPD